MNEQIKPPKAGVVVIPPNHSAAISQSRSIVCSGAEERTTQTNRIVSITLDISRKPIRKIDTVAMSATKRILKKSTETFGSPIYRHRPTRWGTEENGQCFGIIQNEKTGVRYKWIVSPLSFDIKCIGPSNE